MSTTQPRIVLGIAATAAAIPTVLSAIGQVALWTDVVGLDLTAAIAFACFLEAALVASALMARQSIQRGGAGSTDLAATWALSLLSGVLAGAHDVVTRPGDATSAVALSAVARVVAPLVACWLWHRVVIGDREDTGTTWRDARVNARVLAVAIAAQRARSGRQVWRVVLNWRGRQLLRATGDSATVAPRLAATLAGLDAISALPTQHVADKPATVARPEPVVAQPARVVTPLRRDAQACDTPPRVAATLPIPAPTRQPASDAPARMTRDEVTATARRLHDEHGDNLTGAMLHTAVEQAVSLRTCQRIIRDLGDHAA